MGSVMGEISECSASGLSDGARSRSVQPVGCDGGRSRSVQQVGSVMGGDLGVFSQWAQ